MNTKIKKCKICNCDINKDAEYCGRCGVNQTKLLLINNKIQCALCNTALPHVGLYCYNCGEEFYKADSLIEAKDEKEDIINKAPHYNVHPSGIECIEVVRWFNFNLGNAMKYIWRGGEKENNSIVQDLRKALYYVKDEIQRVSKKLGKPLKITITVEGDN